MDNITENTVEISNTIFIKSLFKFAVVYSIVQNIINDTMYMAFAKKSIVIIIVGFSFFLIKTLE